MTVTLFVGTGCLLITLDTQTDTRNKHIVN